MDTEIYGSYFPLLPGVIDFNIWFLSDIEGLIHVNIKSICSSPV